MNRVTLYTLLIAATAIIQALIFDNMTLGLSLLPLVYISFIILLPIQTSQFEMICWGTLLGVAVDFTMGTAGLNTIATLAVSYARLYILNAYLTDDMITIGGVPTSWRIGALRLIRYCATMQLLHSAIFFTAESMNLLAWRTTLFQFAFSSAVALPFIWLVAVLMGLLTYRYAER